MNCNGIPLQQGLVGLVGKKVQNAAILTSIAGDESLFLAVDGGEVFVVSASQSEGGPVELIVERMP